MRAYPNSQLISALPEHDEACPFCKGNEHLTPPPTLTQLDPETGEWQMRVVPNKYPAVSYAPPTSDASSELLSCEGQILEKQSKPGVLHEWRTLKRVDAVGFHEVLIESPAHNVPTALASVEHVQGVVRALRDRGRSMLASDATLRHIMYFKNSGLKAGASLLHPHSQIEVPTWTEAVTAGGESGAHGDPEACGSLTCCFCN